MSTRMILSMGLVTVAVLALLVLQTRPDAQRASDRDIAADPRSVAAAPAPPTRPRLIAPSATAAARTAASEPAAVEPAVDEAVHQARAAEALEQAFGDESVDASWAADTAAEMRRAFTSFPAGTLERVDCRSTMCRLEASFDDAEAEERVFEVLPRTPPFNSHGFIHRTDGEPHEVTIYIARAGHRLAGR